MTAARASDADRKAYRAEVSRRYRQRCRAGVVRLYRVPLGAEALWSLADHSEGRLTDDQLDDVAAVERELALRFGEILAGRNR